jgi:hypothetical protein
MPKIGQMFPSKYLQSEDLKPGITIVTIREVEILSAKRAQPGAELEQEWLIKFDEFRKPMRLKSVPAKVISQVLGSDMTEDWIGHTVGIYAGTYISFGEQKPCIAVDWTKPQTKPSLAAAATDLREIGQAAAERFLAGIKAKGKTYDDFLRFLKANVAGGIELAFGIEIPKLPMALVPAMKQFLDAIHTPALVGAGAGGAVGGEVIDRSTGEVVTAGMTPGQAAAFAEKAVPDDKEIPF